MKPIINKANMKTAPPRYKPNNIELIDKITKYSLLLNPIFAQTKLIIIMKANTNSVGLPKK